MAHRKLTLLNHATQIGDLRVHRPITNVPWEVAMSSLDVPHDIFTSIERVISSDASPVGIDAKKTHVIILHKLQEIEERLRRIEEGL